MNCEQIACSTKKTIVSQNVLFLFRIRLFQINNNSFMCLNQNQTSTPYKKTYKKYINYLQ